MKIQESDIMHAPPYVREIWGILLCRACRKDNKFLKRGQLRITYDEIREALHWMVGWRKMKYSKWNCENAIKWLRKATMITTMKTTRGMIITICNYNIYQASANHDNCYRNRATKATGKPRTPDTANENDKNKYMSIFDESRKLFKGTKRGLSTEYENFVKKHKDWKAVLPLLLPAVKNQIIWRAEDKRYWKNFKTWINNRCWEETRGQARETIAEQLKRIRREDDDH